MKRKNKMSDQYTDLLDRATIPTYLNRIKEEIENYPFSNLENDIKKKQKALKLLDKLNQVAVSDKSMISLNNEQIQASLFGIAGVIGFYTKTMTEVLKQ